MPQIGIDLTHQRFGRLEVLWETTELRNGSKVWLCECSCGNMTRVSRTNLSYGSTLSCGCLRKENMHKLGNSFKHGDARNHGNTRLYAIWASMRNRCSNRNSRAYKYYGKKGIIVCPGWNKEYSIFKKWAVANGYQGGLSIDRINHNGNYKPSNCQWITRSENSKKEWRDYRALREVKIEVSI